MKLISRNILTIVFAALGIFAPLGANQALTFLSSAPKIAQIESMALLLLSVVSIAFLVIVCIKNYNDNHKKLFIIGAILFAISLLSFILNLVAYLALA